MCTFVLFCCFFFRRALFFDFCFVASPRRVESRHRHLRPIEKVDAGLLSCAGVDQGAPYKIVPHVFLRGVGWGSRNDEAVLPPAAHVAEPRARRRNSFLFGLLKKKPFCPMFSSPLEVQHAGESWSLGHATCSVYHVKSVLRPFCLNPTRVTRSLPLLYWDWHKSRKSQQRREPLGDGKSRVPRNGLLCYGIR